jgi:hypothetical protein
LMADLEGDPGFIARRDERDRERQRKAIEWRQAEAPLVEELRAAGFKVDSAWDLVNTAVPYAEALPILLAHVQRPYPDRFERALPARSQSPRRRSAGTC